MTETKTHECQDIRWLPCPDPSFEDLGVEEDVCRICNDTGLRFRGLSRECSSPEWANSTDSSHSPSNHPGWCKCQGTGHVAVDSLEALLEAVESIGELWDAKTVRDGRGLTYEFGVLPPVDKGDLTDGDGGTFKEAIFQVLCRYVGQHVRERP